MTNATRNQWSACLVVLWICFTPLKAGAESVDAERSAIAAWDDFKHAQEARGMVFDWKKFIPPPVPDDQNFAVSRIVASSYQGRLGLHGMAGGSNSNAVDELGLVCWYDDSYPTNGSWLNGEKVDLRAWQMYYRRNAPHTNVFPVPAVAGTPASDVLFALSGYTNAIERLLAASQRPDSRFPLNYDCDFPYTIELPHLASLKRCASTLQLRTCAELQLNQGDRALTDLELMVYLANSVRREPIMISQLVRCTILSRAMESIWEGLCSHQWSDVELIKADRILGGINVLADYKNALGGELAIFLKTADTLRTTPNFENFSNVTCQLFGLHVGTNEFTNFLAFGPERWCCENEKLLAEVCEDNCIPSVDAERKRVYYDLANKAERVEDALKERPESAENTLARYMLPVFYVHTPKFAYCQTLVDLAIVTVALERYRNAVGDYPERLDDLVPRFVDAKKMPHEVMTGLPVNYRRISSHTFSLSAMGWKGKGDSHGNQVSPVMPIYCQELWAWPQ